MPFKRVKGPVKVAKTPGQKKTKYSWIFRHYKGRKNMSKNFLNKNGTYTPHSLQATNWGLKPPSSQADRGKLLRLGNRLRRSVKKAELARKKRGKYTS